MKKIKAIILPTKGSPRLEEITDDLKTYQELVGGNIEAITLKSEGKRFVMIVNEDGVLKPLPFNSQASNVYSLLTVSPAHIFGTAVCVGVDGDKFADFPNGILWRQKLE